MYIVIRSRIWSVLCDPAIDIKFHTSHKLQHHTCIDKLCLKVYLHIPKVIHPKNTTLQHMDLICSAHKEQTVKNVLHWFALTSPAEFPFSTTHDEPSIHRSFQLDFERTFQSRKMSTWFWKNRFKFSNIMHLNVNNFPQSLPGFQTQLRMLRLYIDSAKPYVGPGAS